MKDYKFIGRWCITCLALGALICVTNAVRADDEDDEPQPTFDNVIQLTWPVPDDGKEYILLESASPHGPWIPCPEIITELAGKVRVTLSAAHEKMYFRVMEGHQMVDAFNPGIPWTPYCFDKTDDSKFDIKAQNGCLLIEGQPGAADGPILIVPPGGEVVYTDFTVCVELVGWNSDAEGLTIGLAARGELDTENPVNSTGCLMAMTLGRSQVSSRDGCKRQRANLWSWPTEAKGLNRMILNCESDYQLVFCGVGDLLTLDIHNLSEPDQPVRRIFTRNNSQTRGAVCLFIDDGAEENCRVVVDNFLVTGCTP